MKIEITETECPIIFSPDTCYRYDCFINDVLVLGADCYASPQEPLKIYKHFIKKLIRGWNDKYNKILNNERATKRDAIEYINPRTIVSKNIQDLNLSFKQVNIIMRKQKMLEDFDDNATGH